MAFGRSSSGARGGGSRPKSNRPRYVPRRRVCAFCADKSKVIDFRDATRLRRYISERAKIEGRRKTATCAKHQRQMAEAIKRARHLAMLPYTLAHIRQSGIGGFRGPGRYGPPVDRRPMAPPAAPGTAPSEPAAAQPAATAVPEASAGPVEIRAETEAAPEEPAAEHQPEANEES